MPIPRRPSAWQSSPPEPPVSAVPAPSEVPVPDDDEELIPVPPPQGEKRPEPEPPDDDEMELLPVPSAASYHAAAPDMRRFFQDPSYFPDSFVVMNKENASDAVYHISDYEAKGNDFVSPAFAVTLDAPATEEEWKTIVKSPKRFIAKSLQKGVEVAYAKLNREQRAAMDSAMQVEVDNWLKTVSVKAASQHVLAKNFYG